MIKLTADFGYSSTKIAFNNEMFKLETSISYAVDVGLNNIGEDEVYEFEGEKFYVGELASSEAFTTRDYEFLYKYSPLILYHILKKLKISPNYYNEIELRTGLALVDMDKKDEFVERLKSFTVNGETVTLGNIRLLPQGVGSFRDFLSTYGSVPMRSSLIDIGNFTINFLSFNSEGKVVRKECVAKPGSGIGPSVIVPFKNYLENTFKINFTEPEASQIFLNNKFIFGGVEQPQVQEMIHELKINFMKKLKQSILVEQKKILQTSEVVIVSGGGAYFLEDAKFPPHFKFVEKPYEFSNARGYNL